MKISMDVPHFRLFNDNQEQQTKQTINDLNQRLTDIGVSFQYRKEINRKYLVVNIDDAQIARVQKLIAVNNRQRAVKTGRPRKDFPISDVLQMQAEGVSNVEIIRRLGMSKAGFYAKMKQYRESQESK